MPQWVLDVDAFMVMYPGLTPDDVLNMDLECFEWLPVVREARVRAAEWQQKAGDDAATFRRHGPGG